MIMLRTTRNADIRTIVRVSFLLRLVLLLVSLLGFVNTSLTVSSALAVIFLALTSMAGIAVEELPEVLQRHPIIVVLDAVVMTALMIALGTDNPLVLVVLSSCVVIGVVLTSTAAALSTVVMVAGYLTAALPDARGGDAVFLAALGFPMTFVSVVALGQAFRMVVEQKRQSERALSDLTSSAAIAAERSRLARELHDSTAKTLQGMALTARSLEHWIPRDPVRAGELAHDIADSSDDAVVRLRALLSTLRQDDLDQPFEESLAALARDVTREHGIEVELDLSPVRLSAPGIRYELLAAVREAMTNAAVHSGADQVSVAMSTRRDDLYIEVHDVGCGFSTDDLPASERDGHFGVRGYSERLELIDGRAEVTSAPGAGTRVLLVAPLMGLRETTHDR